MDTGLEHFMNRPQTIESPLMGVLLAASVLYGFFSPNMLETIWHVRLIVADDFTGVQVVQRLVDARRCAYNKAE